MIDPLEWFKRFSWPVYFWVRQIAHATGGMALGGICAILEPYLSIWPWVIVGSGMVGVIIYKEKKERLSGQDFLKTAIDLGAWMVGFWVIFAMFAK